MVLIQLVTFLGLAAIIFITLRFSLRKKKIPVRQFFGICLLALTGLALVYLGLSGRLHWLFVLIGGMMPFLSVLLRNGLRIFRAVTMFRNISGQFNQFTGGGLTGRQQSGQTSKIQTNYFDMRLDHDSGDLDGQILIGQFSNQFLSQLQLNQLLNLLKECRDDQDSVNVLMAYLDRTYPEWKEEDSSEQITGTVDEMNESQALAILGLEEGASREDIVNAHRRLIQKVHPDRGGSTFLAARINEAKSLLIKLKDENDK